VLGLSAVPSPLVLAMDGIARWALIVLGALVALDGIVSLGMPGMVYGEIVLGLLPFLSPWVIGYTRYTGAAWASWLLDGPRVIVGAAPLPW
jgi:hypothetical protein